MLPVAVAGWRTVGAKLKGRSLVSGYVPLPFLVIPYNYSNEENIKCVAALDRITIQYNTFYWSLPLGFFRINLHGRNSKKCKKYINILYEIAFKILPNIDIKQADT